MCVSGGAAPVLKKWIQIWGIPTDHFDPGASQRSGLKRFVARPLSEILVEGSTYNRGQLKRRLFDEGLKQRACELCGQGELWKGRRMSLILDHVNGISTDNRLENLRIVCPNCAATLDTHCGRVLKLAPRECKHCGEVFDPRASRQQYCSRACGSRWDRTDLRGRPNFKLRRVERPPYERLVREIEETSYLAVGRKYGVSDNAIRKWVRQYQAELALARAA
jgi:hypothetical protein